MIALKNHLGSLLRLGLSLILLVIVFLIIDIEHFLEHLYSLDLTFFLLGLIAYFGAVVLWASRWYLLVRATGEIVSFWRIFSTTLIGIFFSLFLPTMVGTDLGRMYELSRGQENKTGVVSTVLLDRLVGLATLILMAMTAILFGLQFTGNAEISQFVLLMAVLMVIGWFVFFNRRVMHHFNWVFRLPLANRIEPTIREIYDTLYFLQSKPRLMLVAAALSLLNQIMEVISVILIARALVVYTDTAYFFVFMPLIWLVTMVPIAISGLGLREGAFAFFFTQVGVTSEEGVAISLLFYSFNVIVGLSGGLILLYNNIKSYRPPPQPIHAATADSMQE